MSNPDERRQRILSKLEDEGGINNYSAWEFKARDKLELWDKWKYIEGAESIPPEIPKLIERHHTVYEDAR